MMNPLNVLSQHKFCINLKRRTDRWKNAHQEFAKIELQNVERFEAYDGKTLNREELSKYDLKPGEVGAILSHRFVLEYAMELKCPNYTAFEDDIAFHPDFKNIFLSFMQHVPADWQMIYLGANHCNGYWQISENVLQMKGSRTIHGVIVRNTVFEPLLQAFNRFKNLPADDIFLILHQFKKSYCVYPHIGYQSDNYSDICESTVDYSFLRQPDPNKKISF